MNGDSAGLEPADRGGADRDESGWPALYRVLREAETVLWGLTEYKAAQAVHDARIRLQSKEKEQREARAVGQGLSGREAVHGENQEASKIKQLSFEEHKALEQQVLQDEAYKALLAESSLKK